MKKILYSISTLLFFGAHSGWCCLTGLAGYSRVVNCLGNLFILANYLILMFDIKRWNLEDFVMENVYKEVYFEKYCQTCVHKELNEKDDPCDECLSNPTNLYSHKPVNYISVKKE